MSPERELLLKILVSEQLDIVLSRGVGELLTQPEQEPVSNQDLISDIEYLITAFEQGADADDYWRPISDLRDDLTTLKKQVSVQKILEEFPLLDDEGLDEEVHHCEWVLQHERKRLHAMLSKVQPLTQPEQVPVAWKDRTYGNLHHVDYGNSIPLYTAPPKRESLSEDEIFTIGYNAGFAIDHVESDDGESTDYGFIDGDGYIDNDPYFKFVRGIEKACGITGADDE
jgi:hypothetical protein